MNPFIEKSQDDIKKYLIESADHCVKCGLCLQECPTYKTENIESESPRGRIALISAIASGKISSSNKVERRLENCLCCRSCEAACPAQVKYVTMIDLYRNIAKSTINRSITRNFIEKFSILALTEKTWLLKPVRLFISLYQRSGIRKIELWKKILKTTTLDRFEKYLPEKKCSGTAIADNKTTNIKSVWLFTGCMGELIDINTVNSATKILQKLGYNVKIPHGQSCCGAISIHNGAIKPTVETAINNLKQFANDDSPILFIATGCGTILQEYKNLLRESENEENAKIFSDRAIEITSFLSKEEFPDGFFTSKKKLTIAVHEPCSHRNSIGSPETQYELLQKLGCVKTVPLNSNNICCGSAGTYMITNPEISKKLLQIKIDDIRDIMPDVVSSTNIGCILHMNSGLQENSIPKITVKHPLEILNNYL